MIIHHCSTGDCDICRRQKVEWLESELSSLRVENEGLKQERDAAQKLVAEAERISEDGFARLEAAVSKIEASLSEARKGK